MSKGSLRTDMRRHATRLTPELPWIGVVLAGILTPLLLILLTGHTFVWRDTARLLAPVRSLVVSALRNFELPLWNPHEALGVPLFAQSMHGVLHPWSLLTAIFTQDGMDLLIVLSIATGAIGAGVLARTLGASRSGAVVAAFGYGFSGYLLSISSVLTYLAAAGTAPWTIAGLRCAAGGGAARLALGAIGVAVLFFAGDPQWAIVAACLGVLLAWEAASWRGAAKAILAVLAGTALAGVQLVPTWEYLKHSTRSAGILLDGKRWPFLPARFLEWVVPGFAGGRIGSDSAPVFQWLGGQDRYSFVPSVFIGLPVLLLAIFGLGKRRISLLLGAAALFFLWLSLGHIVGASYAFGWVPVWGAFRYAEKVIGPFTLCVALLAALGVEPLAARARSSSRGFFAAAAGTLLLAALSAVMVKFSAPLGGMPESVWPLLGERFALAFLLASLGLAAIGMHGFTRQESASTPAGERAGWLLAAVFLTGLCSPLTALHIGSPVARSEAPLAELRASEPVPRILTPLDATGCPAEVCGGLDYLDSVNAVNSRVGLPAYTVPSGVDNFSTYTGLVPLRMNELMKALVPLEEEKFVAYRRLALTHVVLPPFSSPEREYIAQVTTAGGRLQSIDPHWQIAVVAVPHRPWASFAERVLPVAGEQEAREAVVELARARDDTVVLLGTPPATLSRGLVHAVERTASDIRVSAEAPGEGLLVIADAFWDGWQATIDGQPAEILLADSVLRAVRWPAGRHLLEMHYDPVEVKFGAALSGISACLLAGWCFWERRRKHKEI